MHPANHSHVLGVVSGIGAGVLKSTNNGISWKLLGNGTFEGANIGAIAVHPTDKNVLYVSIWSGGPGGGVCGATMAFLEQVAWCSTFVLTRAMPLMPMP